MSNTRRVKQRNPGPGVMPIDRAEAVQRISACIADRTAFVVSAPPDAVATVSKCLANLPGSMAYADAGFNSVLSLSGPSMAALAIMGQLMPVQPAAVFTVPKTIPAGKLSELLGQLVPADGSKDLLMIQTRDMIDLPALLVDAIGKHDPRFAAQMYLNDLRNQS